MAIILILKISTNIFAKKRNVHVSKLQKSLISDNAPFRMDKHNQ